MNEIKLRLKAVDTLRGWVGKKERDGSFKSIIDLYNTYLPHPRNHKLLYTEEWCAGTISAVAIACDLTDIIPVECSCSALIRLLQANGSWAEDDAYVPQMGDLLFYCWSDDGAGDCTKAPNHVGMVEKVHGDVITVIEGNKGEAVSRREIKINARYIRGYGTPNYSDKAKELDKPWYADVMEWGKQMGLCDGTRPNDTATRAEVITICKRLYDAIKAGK